MQVLLLLLFFNVWVQKYQSSLADICLLHVLHFAVWPYGRARIDWYKNRVFRTMPINF